MHCEYNLYSMDHCTTHPNSSLDRHALRQIPRLVDLAATLGGHVVPTSNTNLESHKLCVLGPFSRVLVTVSHGNMAFEEVCKVHSAYMWKKRRLMAR